MVGVKVYRYETIQVLYILSNTIVKKQCYTFELVKMNIKRAKTNKYQGLTPGNHMKK